MNHKGFHDNFDRKSYESRENICFKKDSRFGLTRLGVPISDFIMTSVRIK